MDINNIFIFDKGCFYHCCPLCEPDETTAAYKKRAKQKRQEKKIRDAYTVYHNFNLEVKEECVWDQVMFIIFSKIC